VLDIRLTQNYNCRAPVGRYWPCNEVGSLKFTGARNGRFANSNLSPSPPVYAEIFFPSLLVRPHLW